VRSLKAVSCVVCLSLVLLLSVIPTQAAAGPGTSAGSQWAMGSERSVELSEEELANALYLIAPNARLTHVAPESHASLSVFLVSDVVSDDQEAFVVESTASATANIDLKASVDDVRSADLVDILGYLFPAEAMIPGVLQADVELSMELVIISDATAVVGRGDGSLRSLEVDTTAALSISGHLDVTPHGEDQVIDAPFSLDARASLNWTVEFTPSLRLIHLDAVEPGSVWEVSSDMAVTGSLGDDFNVMEAFGLSDMLAGLPVPDVATLTEMMSGALDYDGRVEFNATLLAAGEEDGSQWFLLDVRGHDVNVTMVNGIPTALDVCLNLHADHAIVDLLLDELTASSHLSLGKMDYADAVSGLQEARSIIDPRDQDDAPSATLDAAPPEAAEANVLTTAPVAFAIAALVVVGFLALMFRRNA